MGFILSLLGYLSGQGAGVAGIGDDFWAMFYNGYIWWQNWLCMYGC